MNINDLMLLKPTFVERMQLNLVTDNRYLYLIEGLKNTLKITIGAVLLGVVIGFIIGMIRSTYDMTRSPKGSKNRTTFGGTFLWILDKMCKIYLTVIRGTPIIVQLLILTYVILISVYNKVLIAILAFGINSGAYVAEIFRSGIMSVDRGQIEAGRSLGFNYFQTMYYIVMPQAFKNVLPALFNEMIVLLKETAVVGYIALQDLTKGGDIIRSRTYDAFFPLILVALIYLVIVMIMTTLVNRLERRLRSNDR